MAGPFMSGTRNMGTEMFTIAVPLSTLMLFMAFIYPMFLTGLVGVIALLCFQHKMNTRYHAKRNEFLELNPDTQRWDWVVKPKGFVDPHARLF